MKRIALAMVIALTSASFAAAGMDRQGNPTLDPEAPSYAHSVDADMAREGKSLGLLLQIVQMIHDEYYKPVDKAKCLEDILEGGVSACTDRYSMYLPPAAHRQEDRSFMDGKYAGIGATMELDKSGDVKVVDVIPGSPAQKAGMRKGDVVVEVSSAGTSGWTMLQGMAKETKLRDTVQLILGKPGTKVGLILKNNKGRDLYVLTRALIMIPFVRGVKMVRRNVGYVRVTAFGGDVAQQFYAAVQKLRHSGARSLIIDLRNNGGGKVGAALNMCSWFAPAKWHATILYTRWRDDPVHDMTVISPLVGVFRHEHVVVLINGNSASASEIFSGYLKYVVHAVIVGQKSFGKGIMQSLLSLPNGGELHLTSAEWFIGPKLIKVHHIGISPTIPVKNPKVVNGPKDDLQLQRAIQEAVKLAK
ncbi:PDZ domain-containing protein [Patescibacteria group bacterium]|nr:PDZ domain-containing protein [Patescibacteria group bacterium]